MRTYRCTWTRSSVTRLILIYQYRCAVAWTDVIMIQVRWLYITRLILFSVARTRATAVCRSVADAISSLSSLSTGDWTTHLLHHVVVVVVVVVVVIHRWLNSRANESMPTTVRPLQSTFSRSTKRAIRSDFTNNRTKTGVCETSIKLFDSKNKTVK